MNKRWTVTCSGCKFYNFPLYCIGTGGFQAKACQIKKPYACICLKASEKGKHNVDSLGSLRSRRNCNDLDDKIKNLKSELTSLVREDSKLEAQNNNNNSNMNARNGVPISVIKQVHKSYDGNISYSGGQVDVNPNYATQKQTKHDTHSNKKEFTDWLDSTIDSLSGTPSSGSDANNYKQTSPRKNRVFNTLLSGNAKCIMGEHCVSKDWNNLHIAQELLYESFLVRNYPSYLIPVNDEVETLPMNLSKRKRARMHGRNHLAKKTKLSNKTHNKQKSNSMKPENSTIMSPTHQYNSDREVEVINLDDDSNHSPIEINHIDCNEDEPKVIVIEDNEPVPEKEANEKGNSGSDKRIWECPICFEHNTGQEVVTTMCGHVFCKKCLEDYYATNDQSCPTCRTNLRDKPLITLFNF